MHSGCEKLLIHTQEKPLDRSSTAFQSKELSPEALALLVNNINALVGCPAKPECRISRKAIGLDAGYKIHLDVGGEGVNTQAGMVAGFPLAINVNDHPWCYEENPGSSGRHLIPYLVTVERWKTNPCYPFADGFANYITMQNAPLTIKNVEEIARCLCPNGIVDLWVDNKMFRKNIKTLAHKLHSKPDFHCANEFPDCEYPKVRIISHIKIQLDLTTVIPVKEEESRQESTLKLTQ